MNNYYLVRDLDLRRDSLTGDGDWFFDTDDKHWHVGLLVYVGNSNREYIVWDVTPGRVWVRER